jgi:molybdenum cofactor cytidylyltransferase
VAYQTIGELFAEEPARWGLRGDPHLWRAMLQHFSSTPLPASVSDLERQIEQAFLTLSGRPLSSQGAFYVERLDHGGMSGGGVSPEFWREQALPLLRTRCVGGVSPPAAHSPPGE